MKEIEAIKQTLAAGPTPGPWFVQYGDDASHMCCTAVGAANTRTSNDGQWSAEECDSLVALTLHQCYPFVEADCERDAANSAYIAACNPAAMQKIIAHIDSQAAEIERLRTDAERYRWLRKQHWSESDIAVVISPKKHTRLGAILPSLELLDDTIDHMRKETP